MRAALARNSIIHFLGCRFEFLRIVKQSLYV